MIYNNMPMLTVVSLPDDVPKNTPDSSEALEAPDNAHQPSAARLAAPNSTVHW